MNKKYLITMLLTLALLFSVEKTFATTIYKECTEEQKENIQEVIIEDDIQYKLSDVIELQNKDTITREESLKISKDFNTNDKLQIIQSFEKQISYEQDGYTGILQIDTNNLQVALKNEAKYQAIDELLKTYENIPEADLNNIPKTINNNGIDYYLTSCIWNITKEDKITDTVSIPSMYSCDCIYKAVITKQGVPTYQASVEYFGVVSKEVQEPIKYKLVYHEYKVTSSPTLPLIPIVTSTGAIIVIIFIIYIKRKNTKLYLVKQDGGKKLIKSFYLNPNMPKLNISKFEKDGKPNDFILVINDKLFSKIKNNTISITNSQLTYQKSILEKEIKIKGGNFHE